MRKTLFLLLALAFVLANCAPGGEGTQMPPPVMTPTSPPPSPQMEGVTPPAEVTPSVERPLAAMVNGQPIYLADYEKQVAQFEASLADEGLDLDSPEGKALLSQMRRQILEAMIEQVLIEQAAAREGVTVSEEEVEAKVQEALREGGGEEKFHQWLAANHLTMEDFKAMLRAQLLGEAMVERVTASVPTSAEQVRARHILVATEEEARELLRQLRAGADFAALARERSIDASTRQSGGDLGFFPRGALVVPPQVEEAAFALSPGQLSDVVASPYGFHIIQVLERDPNRPLSEEMRYALKQQTFMRWLAEQKEKADIKLFVE